MAGLRFQIDGFVAEDPEGTYVPSLGIKIPTALLNNLDTLKERFRQLKAFCSVINEGNINEEDTVRFKYHVCFHDQDPPLPCYPEEDI